MSPQFGSCKDDHVTEDAEIYFCHTWRHRMLYVCKHCSQHGRNFIGNVSFKTVNREGLLNTLPFSKLHNKQTSELTSGD
jgi:hypothetical protein